MDIIEKNVRLLSENKHPSKSSDDIYEHLPTLYNYSQECDSVFETGVRSCISSWFFLHGLLKNGKDSPIKFLFLNDIVPCDIKELLTAASQFKDRIKVSYAWKNNLELKPPEGTTFDLTFIDTWHVYGQLKRELEKFSKFTNKYIIMHDTTVDEIDGETIRCKLNAEQQSKETGFPIEEINKGLWPAVTEFLETHPEWFLKERFTNNNGLTVLARKSIN